ncbi:unnamed protein product [Anisakis simplex]|uniref:TPT domain-containing protein n=1 Tax=Anisakis simplex TaxID=6269 RepID=A0A0M3JVH9_ANISI|nr:unnamed protein product [Anisakis simplex]
MSEKEEDEWSVDELIEEKHPKAEKSVKTMSKLFFMVLSFYTLSIGLTFYQKRFIKTYKLPLLVVTCHYVIKYAIAFFSRCLLEYRNGKRVRIALKDQLKWLVPIGVCASFDIGLSNWALEYVTVSLYTMAKSSSILFIVAFALFLRLERWRTSLGIAAVLIASGLFLFTWRSAELDVRGLLLVELAAACTGVRWTVSQFVMQSEQKCSLKHPLDMVTHVQPWMIVAILPLVFLFEGSELSFEKVFFYGTMFAPFQILLLILFGGFLAFALEIAEYLLLLHTSGITLNIFGIIKEVITLSLAHFVNGDRLTPVNVLGLLLCFSGMALHALSKHRKQTSRTVSIAPTISESNDTKYLLNDSDT